MKTLHLSIIVGISFLFFVFLMIPQNGYAYTCAVDAPPLMPQYYYLHSGSVFVGTVSSISNYTAHQWNVKFNVEKSWKGNQHPIITTYSLVACGYSFVEGEKYLVFASGSPPDYDPWATKPFVNAQNEIALLDSSQFQTQESANEILYKKLINARDALSNMMGSRMSKIPISFAGVNDLNFTLDIGIADKKASLPSGAQAYKQKLEEIVGNVPIRILYAEYATALPEILTQHGILSPLKQFKSEISAIDIKCEQGLQLVIKAEDGSPACVKPETAQKLVERGWTISPTDLKPWMKIDTPSLNNTYVANQPISLSITVKGFGNYPCVSPQIKIHDNKNPNVPVFQDNGSTMSCPELRTSDNYSFDFPGNNSQYVIILNKTGDYTMTISYGDNSVQKYFSVVLPSNPKSITILENNTGIVLLKSQTYYFETPNYTNDAYAHPVQVSFYDVLFTLFPPGFGGGLPSGECMEKGSGLGQYYWTDAKFSDNTHELLHIFADSPPCNTILTMFSNHTTPQAGLTFYNGKMKLLVSANVTGSTEKYNIVKSLGQTYNVSNKTDSTKLRVHFLGGSGSVNMGSDKFNQTGFFSGNVGQVIKGMSVEVSISDPYDMFIRQYEISSNRISKDGSFNFTHTFLGKYDQDVYTLDFSYSNQRYELKYYPVVPP